jgi:endonuclease YncB( thermonuclease family)
LLVARRATIVAFLADIVSTGVDVAAKPHYALTGKVVTIADGDTLTVLDEAKGQHRIRLHGIDTPEKGQAFGTKARENLAAKVFGKFVRVEVVDVDRYRREVGRIYLGDRFINLEMVRDGYAWRYVRYDKAGEFTDSEREAREKRRVLWADLHPVRRRNTGGRIGGRRARTVKQHVDRIVARTGYGIGVRR